MSENIVTRLAREAELVWFKSSGEARLMLETEDFDPMPDLRRFAALVAEECARIIEAQGVDPAFKGRMAWAVRDRFKA